jgi:nicotinamide-nucleotide adenylyltransferase
MKRVGLVCRWKPVHKGHAALLETLCERAEHVLVGIGSANRANERNPFTASESARMIERVLSPRFHNYELISVLDLDDGPRWAAMVRGIFGALDLFVTANEWVRDLMSPIYAVAHPASLVPREKHVPIDGTMVRAAIASGDGWRSLVPGEVASLLEEEGLIARYRSRFGTRRGSP